MQRDDGSLRSLIDLDKTSGKFELDANGYTRFIPSKEKLDYLNGWIGRSIDEAIDAHRARWEEAAKNLEAYKPISKNLDNDGGISILPSPTARMPADQVIASTVVGVLRPKPIISVDAYFDEQYDVILPVSAEDVRAAGIPIAPDQAGDVPMPIQVGAEDLAYNFENGMEFKLRERLDFGKHFHATVQACVTGQVPAYWKTFVKKKRRAVIAPRVKTSAYAPFADPSDEEEYEVDGEMIQWRIVAHSDVIVPNIEQSVNDLEWIAERNYDLRTPDDITRAYELDELHLIKDAEDCQRFAQSRSFAPNAEQKDRTDRSTKKWEPPQWANECPVFDVWFYAYLKVAPPEGSSADTKPKIRRFSLLGHYHYGMRQLMAVCRNPYNHQRRMLVAFQQYFDGASTVGISRHAQELQTYLAQAEVRSSFHANNPLYWYDPNAYDTAAFFEKRKEPLRMGEFVPGKEGSDWGIVRGGFQHYSLLGLMQWNAATSQEAVHSSEYDQGNRVVSHTSPQVVSAMLDRGGQNQKLFLLGLNNGVKEVIRLWLETAAQYQPLGENIPARNPQTKALMTVPFVYPVGEMLDNFRITLTASDEAAMRERDPDQMAKDLALYQQHTGFVAQVLQAMRDPAATPKDVALLRSVLDGENEMYNRIVAQTRVDVSKFDMMPQIDAIMQAKNKALAQVAQQAQIPGGMNGASGQPAPSDGAVPAAGPTAGTAGPSGAGAEPAVAGAPSGTPDGGTLPPVPVG